MRVPTLHLIIQHRQPNRSHTRIVPETLSHGIAPQSYLKLVMHGNHVSTNTYCILCMHLALDVYLNRYLPMVLHLYRFSLACIVLCLYLYSRTCLGRPLVWATTRLGRPQSPARIVYNNKVPGVSDHLSHATSDRVIWFNQR